MKTIIAFSNCKGGKIIFGVKDTNNEVVGIDSENLFKTIDAITNAISDSCHPTIIPDINLQSVGNKTVIVVEVSRGKQTPYYIKSLGVENGTFIRVAGTTRLADEYRIRELMFEGQNKSFDSIINHDISINEDDINNLCKELKLVAMKNSSTEEQKNIKDVTKNTLISWGVLIEEGNNIYPSNAYALLTGHHSLSTKIQCGVFKGITRANFIDRREFEGPIQKQVEEAYKYVLSKINLGANIDGLYRHDEYELPTRSIREIIANAVIHRSLIDVGNVQVALYDNRLEVTSPGMLLTGVTIDKMKEGYSKVRNKAIANAFTYMKIIEQWGSGIPRLYTEFKERGLKEPELIDMDGDFRVNLYRYSYNENLISDQTADHSDQTADHSNQTADQTNYNHIIEKLDEYEISILESIKQNPRITQKELSEKLSLKSHIIKSRTNKLKELKIITRVGTNRKGYWEVILK